MLETLALDYVISLLKDLLTNARILTFLIYAVIALIAVMIAKPLLKALVIILAILFIVSLFL